MIQIGWNYNTIMNNSDQNLDPSLRLPNGYIFRGDGLFPIEVMRNSISTQFLRTFIYLAEHSENETPWLHIPLTDREIDKIADYICDCNHYEGFDVPIFLCLLLP